MPNFLLAKFTKAEKNIQSICPSVAYFEFRMYRELTNENGNVKCNMWLDVICLMYLVVKYIMKIKENIKCVCVCLCVCLCVSSSLTLDVS